ncbi:TolC family protein, partial [Pseudoalteromonas sp. NZS100_1]|nr:TolC family protein [Pseudoalteromonas sp. NZS100_1]
RAAFFPNISLTGAYGTMSDELDGLFSGGSEAWSFTPTIRLPLFNAGRLKGNLDVARARQERAVAQYEQTVQSAFRDVSDALVRRQQLQLQIDTTQQMLDAQRERARLAQLRFDNGRSAYLEVLDAQRDLFDAELFAAERDLCVVGVVRPDVDGAVETGEARIGKDREEGSELRGAFGGEDSPKCRIEGVILQRKILVLAACVENPAGLL